MDPRLVKAQAIVYAEQFGLSVIQLHVGKKKPQQASWREAQEKRATLAEIAQWQACNVGIVTGSVSGIVVVDCESLEDAKWFWKERGKADVAVLTPRGVHLYFKHPGGHVGNRTKVKDETGTPRFDIRGDGGYVVAPPSRVVADDEIKVSGAYQFKPGFELRHPSKIAAFDPKWLPQTTSEGARDALAGRRITDGAAYISRIQAVSGAGGHNATYRAACCLKDSGLTEAEALLVMLGWNKTNAEPPWSEGELLHKIQDAYRCDKP